MASLQQLLGYTFKEELLLLRALTHSSFLNEQNLPEHENNERLEFLGDAVLGLLVAEMLMQIFPEAPEGKLSKWRSNLVSRKSLTDFANQISLGQFIRLGKGEKQTGGALKSSILGSTLEAIIGGIYLDGGLEASRLFIARLMNPFFEMLKQNQELLLPYQDTKTLLQETTQHLYKSAPMYRLLEAWGLEHEKYFRVEILIEGKVVSFGDGRSKKDAEQDAAKKALSILGINNEK